MEHPAGGDRGLNERDRRIVSVLRALDRGEVVSYGDVADVAGYPGRSRLVGRLLAAGDVEVPWWRVVASSGRLVPGNETAQARLLTAEGVTVRAGKVVDAPAGRFRRAAVRKRPLRP